MKINLIACINTANTLGKDGDLLYHISSDLINFKRLTEGNIIIMGRKTYESLPKKPLPNRTTIIISSNKDYIPQVDEGETVFVCDSIESCISTIETINNEDKEVFVIGGATIYRQFIDKGLINKMYLTVVNDDTKGDVYFPEISSDWKPRYISGMMNSEIHTYRFTILEKIKNG